MGTPWKASPNRPSDRELARLYTDEKLSAERIAEICDVQKITVLRWLRAAGVDRRSPGRGLATRGGAIPPADDLHYMIHVLHMSYREVAAKYEVDPTAVPYWLNKYGIQKPTIWGTRRKGSPTPMPSDQELRDRLAAGHSIAAIAADHGVSVTPIRARIRALGLAVRRDGWQGGKRYACLDGHEARSVYEQRVDDWLYQHGLEHECEPVYPWDRRYRADFKVCDTFIEVWGVSENPAYQKRKAMKIQQCKKAGLPLISINHWQFARGRRWWKPLETLLENRSPELFHCGNE